MNLLDLTKPETLKNALKDESKKQDLSALLSRDPQTFFKTIEDVPGAASAVATLADHENACILASVCRETILSAGPTHILYVHVFMHLTKYNIPDVASTLVPLLSSQYAEEATLCLVAWVKKNGGGEMSACVQDLCNNDKSDFQAIAAAFETFMPLVPGLVSVYTSRECKKKMMERASYVQDTQLLLRVVSASCVYEAARKFNTENYLSLLIQGARGMSEEADVTEISEVTAIAENTEVNSDKQQEAGSRDIISSLSLLCIVKLWNFSAVESQIPISEIETRLRTLFLKPVHQAHQYILEAFTYLSLGPKSRQKLRVDSEFTNQLVLVIETMKEPGVLYAGLLLFAKLTQAPESSYTSGLKSAVTKEEENTQDIEQFNQELISEYKLVQTLCAVPISAQDQSLSSERVEVLYNIIKRQKVNVLREAVVQGALPVLVKYLIEHVTKEHVTDTEKQDNLQTTEINYLSGSQSLGAARALATLSRSVDPRLAFSKYDVKTCVPFLVELVRNSEKSSFPLLDKLDGLLALTNIACMPESDLHALIIGKMDFLPDLFLDSVPQIQKAAWELVNNLVSHPKMLAKFFNEENAQSRKNLEVLVKMLHSQDASVQVTIAGILANSTMEYELVCRELLKQQQVQLQQIIGDILVHQRSNEDLLLRVVTLMYNMQVVPESSDFFSPLKRDLGVLSKEVKNLDILEMVKEILNHI